MPTHDTIELDIFGELAHCELAPCEPAELVGEQPTAPAAGGARHRRLARGRREAPRQRWRRSELALLSVGVTAIVVGVTLAIVTTRPVGAAQPSTRSPAAAAGGPSAAGRLFRESVSLTLPAAASAPTKSLTPLGVPAGATTRAAKARRLSAAQAAANSWLAWSMRLWPHGP